MDIPNIRPPALTRGDTFGIIAPAGPLQDRGDFEKGISALSGLGFQARFDERIFERTRYLAGDDRARADELMRFMEDPSIGAIIPLRGGYGCARLIPHLDETRLRKFCKVFIGFSDLTTLHLFFRRRFGWTTLHGPMMTTLDKMTDPQRDHLLAVLTDPQYLPGFSFPQLETWRPGVAEGRVVGGCLSLITASLATRYEIRTRGNILFLEDQGEPPYRIDRMLTHLRLAGKLDHLAGLLIGGFEMCNPDGDEYTVWDTLRESLEDLDIPTLAKFPAGHGPQNWTIPLGVRMRLDAGDKRIQMLDSAVYQSK